MKPEKFDPKEKKRQIGDSENRWQKKSRHDARRKNHPKKSLRDPSKKLP